MSNYHACAIGVSHSACTYTCVEQRRGWGVEARPSVGTRHDVVDLRGVRHDFQDVAGQLCGGPPSPDGIVMREGGARI